MTSRATWLLVAAGTTLIAVCYGFARFAYGLTEPEMRADLDVSGAVSGLIASSSYVGYCVAIVVSSLLTPVWGARRTATAAGLVATAGTALVAVAPNAAVLAVGVLIAGSSTGAASPPLASAVARWVARPRRDRSQTVVNAGTGIGVAVSGPVVLAAGDAWRLAWAVFSVVAVVATAWIWLVLPADSDDTERVTRPSSGTHRERGLRQVVPPVVPGAGRLLLVAFGMGAVSVATWTFGRQLVQSSGDMGATGSAVLWIALGVAGVLGAAGGDLAARVGPGRLWRVLLLALSGATALLAVAPAGVGAYAAAVVFGAAYIALTGLVLVSASRVWPDHVGAGVGAGFLAIAVGQAVGAPLLGFVAEALTLPVVFLGSAVTGALVSMVALPDDRGEDAGEDGGAAAERVLPTRNARARA
ncbi:MFS transporter [Nocardioidaceae bacterium]|nr:MFS transporter [Nocardioidaceae bacterium]